MYAYNFDAPEHSDARQWVEALFAGPEWIGLPWLVLMGVSAHRRKSASVPPAHGAEETLAIMRGWLALPRVVVVQPGPRHAEILESLVIESRASAALVTDAALAAIAIEQGAVLASTDLDFSRFPTLRWLNPVRLQAK
ncbi:MAG: PIN domain-containing protein [Actinobacteria bacterium]|nr:PIN domain-containing protein [Actinomycetota bacterium]